MRGLFVWLLLILPAPLLAQGLYPALFDVIGVASDDVLNIRAEPHATAPIIGMLAPDARGVEVLAPPEAGWGRVNAGEGAGWVAVRFLARQPGQDWGQIPWGAISPTPLECFGTEPFWSLDVSTHGSLSFSHVGEQVTEDQSGSFTPVLASFVPIKRGFVGQLDETGARLTGVITHELCSDGMSDRLYGLSIDIVRESSVGPVLDTGCCRLAP